MKIRIAFYKGRGDWKNAIVRWWTKSEYSHADLVLPDGVTWVGISPFIKSVVSKRIFLDYDQSEWDFIDIHISAEQYSVIMDFFQETSGQKYDWIGMLCSQFLPFKIIAAHLVLIFFIFLLLQLPQDPSILGTPMALPEPKIINFVFISI